MQHLPIPPDPKSRATNLMQMVWCNLPAPIPKFLSLPSQASSSWSKLSCESRLSFEIGERSSRQAAAHRIWKLICAFRNWPNLYSLISNESSPIKWHSSASKKTKHWKQKIRGSTQPPQRASELSFATVNWGRKLRLERNYKDDKIGFSRCKICIFSLSL